MDDDVPEPISGAVPQDVRAVDSAEAVELARLAAAFGDLQHVLLCCERLVAALSVRPGAAPDPTVAEALWTSALLAYARCFTGRDPVLAQSALAPLGVDDDADGLHTLLLRLRDHYASREDNPREAFTVGVAVEDRRPVGVAVVAAAQPSVDQAAVGRLGRLAYALCGALDARMRAQQAHVVERARALDPARLDALPQVRLDPSGAPAW